MLRNNFVINIIWDCIKKFYGYMLLKFNYASFITYFIVTHIFFPTSLVGNALVWLFFKVFSIQKCIKIIFFFELFLTSAHQNDLKTPKNINLK
jgi:hypothetical protein